MLKHRRRFCSICAHYILLSTSNLSAQGALDAGLSAALRSGSPTTINHALHAYAAIGDPGGAERAVRDALVAPAVASVLDARKGPGADALPDVRFGARETNSRIPPPCDEVKS